MRRSTNTLKKLEALAAANPRPVPPPKPPGPNDVIEFDDMSFEQVNPPAKIEAHEVSNRTIEELSLGSPLLQQGQKATRIHELRFRIKIGRPQAVLNHRLKLKSESLLCLRTLGTPRFAERLHLELNRLNRAKAVQFHAFAASCESSGASGCFAIAAIGAYSQLSLYAETGGID